MAKLVAFIRYQLLSKFQMGFGTHCHLLKTKVKVTVRPRSPVWANLNIFPALDRAPFPGRYKVFVIPVAYRVLFYVLISKVSSSKSLLDFEVSQKRCSHKYVKSEVLRYVLEILLWNLNLSDTC